jgi:hypothetical protein
MGKNGDFTHKPRDEVIYPIYAGCLLVYLPRLTSGFLAGFSVYL